MPIFFQFIRILIIEMHRVTNYQLTT